MPAPMVNDKSESEAKQPAESVESEAPASASVEDGAKVGEPKVVAKAGEPQGVDEIKAVTGVEVIVVQRNPDRITRRPRELLVKVRLPGLTSAAGVDVDVDGAARSLRVDHMGANLHAQATLPFPVDSEAGSATFNSDTSLLVLTLPVVAPKEEAKDALNHLEGESTNPNSEGGEQGEDHAM